MGEKEEEEEEENKTTKNNKKKRQNKNIRRLAVRLKEGALVVVTEGLVGEEGISYM